MLLTFLKGSEVIVIKIVGKQIFFNIVQNGVPMQTTIEGLKLNPVTIVEEFPDLKGKPIVEIKKEGVRRFKEHIAGMNTQEEIKNYLEIDLRKHGFKLTMIHRLGHRPQLVKN